MIQHIATEAVAIVIGLITIAGAIVAAQWLYYWPKVQNVVEQAVGDAMKVEREFTKREVARVDKSHDKCRAEVDTIASDTETGVRDDIKYIRGRLDWLVDKIVNGTGVKSG